MCLIHDGFWEGTPPVVNDKYRQCKISRMTEDGEVSQITWLSSEIAIVGNIIRIKEDIRDEWSEGWRIISVSNSEMNGDFVEHTLRHQYKHAFNKDFVLHPRRERRKKK